MKPIKKKASKTEQAKLIGSLRTELLARLANDSTWIEECQDRADDASEEAEKVVAEAGYGEESDKREALLADISVSWVPGHYE